MDKTSNVIEHESRPVARKPRDAAAVFTVRRQHLLYKFKSTNL